MSETEYLVAGLFIGAVFTVMLVGLAMTASWSDEIREYENTFLPYLECDEIEQLRLGLLKDDYSTEDYYLAKCLGYNQP